MPCANIELPVYKPGYDIESKIKNIVDMIVVIDESIDMEFVDDIVQLLSEI